MTKSDAADLLVEDTLWILDSTARAVRHKYPMVEHDELVSVGFFALKKASESYEPRRGPFGLYAWIRVAGAMMDLIRKGATVSSRMHHAGLQALALLNDTGDMMRDDEAQHRVTAKDYLSAVAAAVRASLLSSHTAEHATGELDEQLARDRDVEDVREALDQVAPEQRLLLEQHYMKSMTLYSIADQLKVSYSTARRRHNEALDAFARAIRLIRAARR